MFNNDYKMSDDDWSEKQRKEDARLRNILETENASLRSQLAILNKKHSDLINSNKNYTCIVCNGKKEITNE